MDRVSSRIFIRSLPSCRDWNKGINVLSWVVAVLQVIIAHVVKFERMMNGYLICTDFDVIYQEIQDGHCQEHINFVIRYGYLFRWYMLCIPCTSIQDILSWKLHSGSQTGHFGWDIAFVEDRLYWPSSKRDCWNCISVWNLSPS